MDTSPTGPGPIIARIVLRATVLAIYLTAAFAIAPALSTGAEIGETAGQLRPSDGILAALGVMVATVGVAIGRWFRGESAA